MNKKPRIEVVDALRGFAIMAIMLLHCIERFNFYSFPDKSTLPDWLNTLDKGIWESLFFLFGGKAYAIFSLLFGFTFSLMLLKQRAQGKSFHLRFLWRMLLLAAFALINGAFFPGEVLMMYALLGCLLISVSGFNNRVLLIVAGIFLLQPLKIYELVQVIADDSYSSIKIFKHATWSKVGAGQSGDSFWNLIKLNTQYGHFLSLQWAWGVGRLIQTLGLFTIGFWLGKNNKFTNTNQNIRFWIRTLLISAITFAITYALLLNLNSLIDQKAIFKASKKMITMYSNAAFTGVLFSGFILLFYKTKFQKLLNKLCYPGRMSLTAYIAQSILGGFVFYGYGLGLASKVSHSLAFLIGIALFILQYFFCKWWINKFKMGPFERLWHRLTWLN